MRQRWLEPPDPGTNVCGGFDGSTSEDWTVIKLETAKGMLLTPRYGPDRRATIWNPAEWGGQIPRDEVHAAWAEINDTYRLGRVYCDPPQWQSEIGTWARLYGDDAFLEWATYRTVAMHEALDVFHTDLSTGALTHDGCPLTTVHMMNARKTARPGDRYGLGRPSKNEKIDATVTSVLAHKAAVDARATGWGSDTDSRIFCFR